MTNLLPFQKLQKQMTNYLRDPINNKPPDNIDLERLNVYKDLLFDNILDTLQNSFPVCKEVLSKDEFKNITQIFFQNYKVQSPYFYDIPKAFVNFLDTFENDKYPAFLYELAHYEWVELALELADINIDFSRIDIQGDLLNATPAFSPYAWILQYNFPVDRISKNYQPPEPLAEPIIIIVYRDFENKINFLKPNLLTVHLINLLVSDANLTSKEALLALAKQIHPEDTNKFIQSGHDELIKLKQQSIILGTKQ